MSRLLCMMEFGSRCPWGLVSVMTPFDSFDNPCQKSRFICVLQWRLNSIHFFSTLLTIATFTATGLHCSTILKQEWSVVQPLEALQTILVPLSGKRNGPGCVVSQNPQRLASQWDLERARLQKCDKSPVWKEASHVSREMFSTLHGKSRCCCV